MNKKPAHLNAAVSAAPPSPEKCRRAQYHGEVAICGICHYQAAAPESSPLPWIAKQLLDHVTQAGGWVLLHASPKDRARMARVDTKGEFTESDAALIVRRVNQGPAFDALLKVALLVEECRDNWWEWGNLIEQLQDDARAALKLAQEVK